MLELSVKEVAQNNLHYLNKFRILSFTFLISCSTNTELSESLMNQEINWRAVNLGRSGQILTK